MNAFNSLPRLKKNTFAIFLHRFVGMARFSTTPKNTSVLEMEGPANGQFSYAPNASLSGSFMS
jgi:hypothetical protein